MSEETETSPQGASVEAPAESASAEETTAAEPVSPPEPIPAPEPTPVSMQAPVSEPIPAPEPMPVSEPSPQQIPLSAPVNPIPGLLAKARVVLVGRKQKKLEKILKLAREKARITNDDAQKLLRVSDATATRYLSQLVKEGKLRQTGHPRHAVYEFPG